MAECIRSGKFIWDFLEILFRVVLYRLLHTLQPTANRPRVVKRGVDEFNIEDGEPEQVNHLLFMVHGIGAGCDLKFRAVEEVGKKHKTNEKSLRSNGTLFIL